MNLIPVGLQRVLPGLALLGISPAVWYAATIFFAASGVLADEKTGCVCLRKWRGRYERVLPFGSGDRHLMLPLYV